MGIIGGSTVRQMAPRHGLGLAHDPTVYHIQAQSDPSNQPPRFAARGRIFFRNAVLTVRTPLGILVDVPMTVRTRDCGVFVVVEVLAIVGFVLIEVSYVFR